MIAAIFLPDQLFHFVGEEVDPKWGEVEGADQFQKVGEVFREIAVRRERRVVVLGAKLDQGDEIGLPPRNLLFRYRIELRIVRFHDFELAGVGVLDELDEIDVGPYRIAEGGA